VRGIEIRGQAEVLPAGGTDLGPGFDPEMMRIKPRRIISWGIDTKAAHANARPVA
jgi:pyridoxamine 5'-phosphate oxidase family protein